MLAPGGLLSRVFRARALARRDPLGPFGERAARRFLRRSGYRTLATNMRTSVGEIDLIMEAPDRRTVVFVEVKARRVDPARPSPPPEASVHARKRAKLLLLVKQVSRKRGWLDRPLRIDIVAVEQPADGSGPVVRHFVNAVSG